MILLTGATGFLGRHIAKVLLEAGYSLRVLVRNPQQRSLPWEPMVEIAEGDVTDIASLATAMEGVDTVVHAAAIVSFWKKRKAEIQKVNVEGTANVVNMCLELGVKKLIQVSSIAALGKGSEQTPINEDTPWVDSGAVSDYARSKYQAELEVYRGIEEGLYAVMVNPGVILGPSADWEQGTAKMFSIVDRGLSFYNRGVSGWVSAEDVARAIELVIEKEPKVGERYTLVSENINQAKAFTWIAEALGKTPPKWQLPPWLTLSAGWVSERLAAVSGKEPIITLQTMKSSIRQFHYDGSKITQLGFSYTPIKTVIQDTAEQYLKDKERISND